MALFHKHGCKWCNCPMVVADVARQPVLLVPSYSRLPEHQLPPFLTNLNTTVPDQLPGETAHGTVEMERSFVNQILREERCRKVLGWCRIK